MKLKRPFASLLPILVGVISLGLTLWLWTHERQTEEANLRASFDFGLRQATSRIEQRMAGYEQMVRGTQGLLMASDRVDRQRFSIYVDAVLAGAGADGLRAIVYAPLLSAGNAAGHVDEQRAAGVADYAIRPPGVRAEFAPATYIAPATGNHLKVLGYDPLSDPIRRNAMLRARDSGGIAVTDKIRMIGSQDPEPQPGFLMFLPLYEKGQAVDTAAARRAHLVGWVWAAFRLADMMSSLYGEGTPGLDLRIYDGVELNDDTLMYRSTAGQAEPGPARFEAQEYVGFSGHTWTLQVRTLPEFERMHSRGSARVILAAGSGLSLLLAMLTYQWVTGRARANDRARAMTRELRDSEERYRRIVETANEGIWTIDDQARISFVNPMMQKMLGYTEADMLGRPIADFVDGKGQAGQGQSIGQAWQGTPEQHDLKLRRKDGSELWALMSVSPKLESPEGGFAGALGMITDITERMHAEAKRTLLEAQLRESQKMESIGTLAGGIAHDFNNILAVILGNVASARHDTTIGQDPQHSLAQIDKAAIRARSLVQQILAFSRMQPHVLVIQPLRPLVEESVTLLRSTLPAQVEFDVELTRTPLYVGADATQVQQVLMNLLTNAWHSLNGSRGRISIGLDAVVLDFEATQALAGVQPGNYAHLWVRDTGSGMDEATRVRVFEPFFTTKPVGQGTGLGLSVVHGIVAAHKGAVTVDSTPGHGSTFHLYLPLTDHGPFAVPTAPAPLERMQGQGEHVLCVDDDPAMLIMVEGLLQRSGYRVTAIESPREALAAMRAQPDAFDVIVTDFNMPELTGIDFAHEVLRMMPAVPVVITSGYISEELRAAASQLGVRRLLEKEYTLEQLASVVHSALVDTED